MKETKGPRELRVAVGSSSGRRSTVWKFEVRKNDIYVFTRMFGAESKVSLHETGECQWSATDTWVKKDSTRKNADRHMVKWHVERPTGLTAQHIFRVRIPESELRFAVIDENLSKVRWLSAPAKGHTLSLECYLTPPSAADPALNNTLPHSHLISLPLADGRWFVILCEVFPLDGMSLMSERAQVIEQGRAAGIEPSERHRACLFAVDESGVRGLIEVCPVSSPFEAINLLPTAYHEAGHAVVAWCLGLEVQCINIRPDDAGGSAVIGTAEHLAMVDRIAVAVAGAEAEHVFAQKTHELGIYDDMGVLVTLLDEILEPEAMQLRQDGYRRAHDLLVAHKDKVTRLAERLVEVQTVDAAEFLRLMSP